MAARTAPNQDRLSALPEDVVLYILVRVDLITAARTSALSTRWMGLPWLLPKLNIDVKDFVSVPHSEPIATNIMAGAMLTLREATNSLFAKPQRESVVTSLRLKLDFFDIFSCNIAPVLCDAVDSGLVKDLDLAILDETRSYCALSDMPKRGQELYGLFLACPSVFHCLTRLSFSDLGFAQLDMNHILFEQCRKLKHLALSGCDAGGDCSVWKIDAPNSKLRFLVLRNCWFERVELISLPKLEKLIWDIWQSEFAPLSFGFVPALQILYLSNCFDLCQNILKLSELLHGTTGMHTLMFGFSGQNVWIQAEMKQLTSVFSKLRKLSLLGIFVEFDLLWTTTFLDAAPSVEILHIEVNEHSCDVDRDFFPERSSPQWELDLRGSKNLLLKEIQIVRFRLLEQQLAFVRAILKRSPNLRAVLLKQACHNCEDRNAITHNAPPCVSPQPAYPTNKDEQDLVLRRATDGTFFSGRIVFCD